MPEATTDSPIAATLIEDGIVAYLEGDPSADVEGDRE